MNDRWLDARIAGPLAGTFSSPVTRGRPSTCRTGPMTTRESWYCTRPSSAYLGVWPATGRPGEGGDPAKATSASHQPRAETDAAMEITSGTANGSAAAGTMTPESSANQPITRTSQQQPGDRAQRRRRRRTPAPASAAAAPPAARARRRPPPPSTGISQLKTLTVSVPTLELTFRCEQVAALAVQQVPGERARCRRRRPPGRSS